MHRQVVLLSAALALAGTSAAWAMHDPAAAPGASARAAAQATAHQVGAADVRIAIILQRKPAKQNGK